MEECDSFPMEVWMCLRREVSMIYKLDLDKLPKMAVEYETMNYCQPTSSPKHYLLMLTYGLE